MFVKKSFSIAIIFLLCSCVSNLQRLALVENKMKMEGFYTSYLSLEYLDYSRSLLQNDDYLNAEYFAKKGLDASKGYDLALENPYYWYADQVEIEDLVSAQKRYEKVSTAEVRNLLPIQMAHLTFLYDCWASKEAKPAFRLGEMRKCKERFYTLIDEVEYFIANLGKDKAPKTVFVERQFERYLVIFDFDKFKINEKANKKMVEILNVIDALDGDYCLVLVGNADRAGKNLYNETLALKRAKVIEQYLNKNGVGSDLIEIRVEGEEFPDLITKDKVRQQFNRTVGVYIVKGAKSVRDVPLPVIKNEAYKLEITKEKKKRGLK